MFTRREFVGPLGAAALTATLPRTLRATNLTTPDSEIALRSRIDLNGSWSRYVDGVFFGNIEVPSSQHPLGCYELKRNFLLPQLSPSQRAILHFEAVTCHGRVSVNKAELGVMGPYMPYEFDATPHLHAGTNEISVTIRDLLAGPDGEAKDAIELVINPGWEAYGGIVRQAYIEIRPASYVENVRVAYQLTPPYSMARGTITAFVNAKAATSGKLRITLLERDAEVFAGERQVDISAGTTEAEVPFEFKDVALWSTDRPNLYRVGAELQCGAEIDQYECHTGFRHVEIRGADFYLNGEKIKLHGLSWLGTWKDQGFTLTRNQMKLDMRAMKDMGCNFVRLHLFPQDRYMVELADELGMFVCEEPGFWQVDFTKMRRSLVDLGLDIMARTIRRDWNSPSVLAWLLGNESEFTEIYLKEGKALCNKVDPLARPVSVAHINGKSADAKKMFDAADLDFYSSHPYTPDASEFDRVCEIFGISKPLVFDEWGGRAIGQSQIVLQEECDEILDLMGKNRLAGEMFFSWNDFLEFARVDGEMLDGLCQSGVVTERREQRQQVFSQLSLLFQGRYQQLNTRSLPLIVEPLRQVPWSSGQRFASVDLQAIVDSPAARDSWAALERQTGEYWDSNGLTRGQWKRAGGRLQFWKDTPLELLGVTFRCPVVEGYVRALAVTSAAPQLEIPIKQKCSRLHLLGQVSLPTGFPIVGTPGQPAGEYVIRYAGGKTQHVTLRHGIEICSGNLIHQASRIAPVPRASQKSLTFVREYATERYQVLLLSINSSESTIIESLTFSLERGQLPLLLFAVTAELA